MKDLKASEFPELQKAFSGYLHEDFREEYASPAAAMRGYLDDADATERRRLREDARRLLERIDGISMSELRMLMSMLGCRWTPPTRRSLVALLTEVAAVGD